MGINLLSHLDAVRVYIDHIRGHNRNDTTTYKISAYKNQLLTNASLKVPDVGFMVIGEQKRTKIAIYLHVYTYKYHENCYLNKNVFTRVQKILQKKNQNYCLNIHCDNYYIKQYVLNFIHKDHLIDLLVRLCITIHRCCNRFF